MNIHANEVEMLLSFTHEMAALGYKYAAYSSNQICSSDTLECFRASWEAAEYCLVMTDDRSHFKSVPINSLISDLKSVMHSGIDTNSNETLDLTASAGPEMEKIKLLENNLNRNTMNQKNLEYLKEQLKYTGFGETFDTELKENMTKGKKEFKITHNGVYNKDTMSVDLNFKKSDQSDMYFFNSYHVNLKKEESKQGLEQTFYINNDSASITLKEAYNLMEGRAVNKDLKNKQGEAYNCWIKIDFKQADDNGNFKLNHYHQNYGYDLEASLNKHSIKELDTPKFKEDLINSLKKGNLQSVTFVVAGAESKMHVEANPQFKTLNVYDSAMQRINHRESKAEKQSQGESPAAKHSEKKQDETDQDAAETPGKSKKKRKQQSNSL